MASSFLGDRFEKLDVLFGRQLWEAWLTFWEAGLGSVSYFLGGRFGKRDLLFGGRLVVVLLAALALPASLGETAQPDAERVVSAVTVVTEHHLILQGQGQFEGHRTFCKVKLKATGRHLILQG